MTQRIGFVGLGNMGALMAANLLRQEGALTVHDLRPAAADALCEAGAVWADDLETLARGAEVAVTSLPGPKEIEQAAFGERGLLANLAPGALWIDTSTNDPALARRLAEEATARSIAFVDAPVTGGVIGARAGSLKIMAGGADEAVARAWPLLSAMASGVVHCGPAGSGAAMKLIVNFLGIAHTALAAEALALGRAEGLAPETMLSVLAGCWGENAMLNDLVETAGSERHWGFALDLARKDMALAIAMAADRGFPLRGGEATLAALETCAATAPANSDLWRLVEDRERDAGTTVV